MAVCRVCRPEADWLGLAGWELTANSLDDALVGREAARGLFSDLQVIDPDREFAAMAGDDLSLEAKVSLDSRRHPGGVRPVVSSLAIPNADGGHGIGPYWGANCHLSPSWARPPMVTVSPAPGDN